MRVLLETTDADPALQPQDSSKESPWDGVKAACCSNITLIAAKEEEDFLPHAATFLQAVWQLLLGITPATGQVGP